MNVRERQEHEISTIKEKELKINLSDADMLRLWKKAGSVGMTAGELLASFIGDLVDGTYSNGSDERMYAQQWFERCGFGMFPEKTFLRYLIEWNELESVLSDEKNILQMKADLAELETRPDKNSDQQEEIEYLKEEISGWEESIDKVFSDFVEWCRGDQHSSYEKEMQKVRAWYNEMKGAL
jgi:hypothetical protein